jgi:hypothetical protein
LTNPANYRRGLSFHAISPIYQVKGLSTMALDSESVRRVKEYEASLRAKRVQSTIGYACVAFLTVVLFMVLSGDTFQSFLSYLGLRGMYNAEKGVYADCSKPENSGVAYCAKRKPPTEQDWKRIRTSSDGPVFDLYGH